MIRQDEDMPLGVSVNIRSHPTFRNAQMFATVFDNYDSGRQD